MFGDTITSFIRTYVPIYVGVALTAVQSWLLDHHVLGIPIDTPTAAVWVTSLVIVIYYAVARFLEKRWPRFGVLLGSVKKPAYGVPGEPVTVDPTLKKVA